MQLPVEKNSKLAKNLTLASALSLTVVTLLSVLQVLYLVALSNTDLSKLKELTAEQAAVIRESITLPTILFFAGIALIYLIVTVFMYLFVMKIKKRKAISVIPYYVSILMLAYSFLQSAIAVNIFNAALYFIVGVVVGFAVFYGYKYKKSIVSE
ncbi:hypothetical protein ACN6J9_05815 [Carnobacterium maltaromaticum]|uniref:hypothetical protein n=1 Tax=Carnobacterium maltaromaticum TaxID=2751 RepID=UPI000704F660|nr:hypothetical protein [Carnobacterium maltaromaticum]KRN72964.1 hypothetical protein IV76_GL002068 [Carnobacterium maltaromaticum]MBC9808952.1 hypothetical protein [Carnobacterium maltaromaticum]CRH20779.1 putative membrane protein [Carnobacterium maltaromaticum]